jgi:hypothetical protein
MTDATLKKMLYGLYKNPTNNNLVKMRASDIRFGQALDRISKRGIVKVKWRGKK